MLNHTKKIKEMYEDIQRRLYYMIPEKWEKLYLYSSVIDMPNGDKKGELYFYYIPKGILKKKPVNVYEIPNKFNLDESDYLKLVGILYTKIKKLREEFRKSETGGLWSNITMSIENNRFKVEYNYEDLNHSDFNSYERHIIWRYEYLGIGEEQVGKKDREILKRYLLGPKMIRRKEKYETGIYISDVENKIAYNTDETPVNRNNNSGNNSDNNIGNSKEMQQINSIKKEDGKESLEEQIKKYEEKYKKQHKN